MSGVLKIETTCDEVNEECTVIITWNNLEIASLNNEKKVFHLVPGKSSSWQLEWKNTQPQGNYSAHATPNNEVVINLSHISGDTEIGSGTLSLMSNTKNTVYQTENLSFKNKSGKLCEFKKCYEYDSYYNGYRFYSIDSYGNRRSQTVVNRGAGIKIVCSITLTNYTHNQRKLCPADNNIGTKEFCKKLYTSKVLTDVKFALGNIVLEGHRAILSNRSDVFARMFQQDMVEKNRNNAITIKDCDSVVFDAFLKYLYVNEIEDSTSKDWKIVLPLLQVAHEYKVNCLVDVCSDLLIESFSIDNVLKILQVADLHKLKNLKDSAKTFVNRNFNTIGASAEWSQMISSHPSIVTEIFIFMTSTNK